MEARHTGGRILALDMFRGLIMILMALDHASYFIAGVHQTEIWSRPLPRYGDALTFLTRLVTHGCAPGFFLLLGAGLVLFAGSRERAGWPEYRIRFHLALRGALLVALQFLVENPAWSLRDSGSLRVSPYCGVLYGLGGAMLLWSLLLRLPSAWVLCISLVSMAAAPILLPTLPHDGGRTALWLGMVLVPGKAGGAFVLYPLVPWFGVTGLGLCFGRGLQQDAGRMRRLLLVGGCCALAAFLVARLAGIGDVHPSVSLDWISFFNVTKYPPSLDFLLLTLGVDALALRLFMHVGSRAGVWGEGLAVFGRTPLFFYLTHLYVYALIGLALAHPPTLAGMYPFWLLGLAVLYPLCRIYGRLRANLLGGR